MPSWPADWINRTLTAAGIPATSQSIAVMRAWRNSTPLPPLTNNPLGMPAGTSGAPVYLHTKYAIFPTMQAFYSAFGAWSKREPGSTVIAEIDSSGGYPAAWRAISSLGWPASLTETDYPAVLLDLTAQSYRDSVKATDPGKRKTSGAVGVDPEVKATIQDHNRAMYQALASGQSALEATRIMLRKATGNG